LKPKSELFDAESRQEILNLLPVQITAIEIQKKNPNRVSVFGDTKFLFGLSLHASQKIGLHVGFELNEESFHEIEMVGHYDSIRTWLLLLLGKRAYSRYQLFEKCKKDGYPQTVTNQILDEFEERGWLNDESFARAYANDKFRFQKWGPQKIRIILRQKGISDTISRSVTSELIDKTDQIEMLRLLIDKKKNHFLREPDFLKRKKKVLDYLLRKGYDQNIVFSNYDRIMQELQI
jgi:regulatory protein